MSNFQPTAKNW